MLLVFDLKGYILERIGYSSPIIGKRLYCLFSLNTNILIDYPITSLSSIVAKGTLDYIRWSSIVRHCRAIEYYFFNAAKLEYRLYYISILEF